MIGSHGLDRLVHIALFALAHYAALIGLAALSYEIGRKLTAKYQYHSPWERAAVCTSLGLGAIAYLVLGLCLVHGLYRGTVLGTLGFVAISGFSELRSLAKDLGASLRSRWNHGRLLAICIGSLILFLPFGLQPLYPPAPFMSADATWYHLTLAKLYVQHHGFVFTPYVHFSLFPQLNEMLFTLMLTLFDDVAAQLVSFLMMGVVVIALVAMGRRLFSSPVGYWATAIFLANPGIIWLSSVAYIDMSLTLFTTMAVYASWNWLHDRARHWLVLAAIFAGFAAGTKYSGLFFFGLLSIVVLSYGIRDRRFTPSLLFVTVAAAIAAPWYARNVYYTGNPVFPFFSTIFGSGFWTAEDISHTMYDLLQNNGVGRSVWAFVSLPWQLAFNPRAFNPDFVANRRFYLLMPVLVAFALKDARIRALCAVAFCYIVFWFFSSQETRYLAPVFPLISLSMAAALNSILEWRPPVRRWARHGVVIAAVFVVLIYSGEVTAVAMLRAKGPLPVTQVQRDEYLARHASYPAYKLLNALKGRHYTLYALEDPFMAYFADGTYMGDDVGPARYSRVRSRLADSRGLYRELRSLGADYLLLVQDPGRLHEDEFFHSHFILIYARPPVMLFEIAGEDERR